ncbi:MAG TPA: sugar phosphate isomerase/epimerase family protein [Candidatus Brocadiia bacterium]|nr:sugar phosphate isomerase/epimerase family protein [Candidatus Brocadiia bacterium]
MKKSLARFMLPPDLPLEAIFPKIKAMGYDGIQLLLGADKGDVRLGMSDAELKAILAMAGKAGIEIHSLLPSGLGRFIDPDPAARKKTVDEFKQGLAIARKMGIHVMLVHPGQINEQAPYDAAYDWVKTSFEKLVSTAEKTRCCLAIENVWNKFLLSPLEMRDFVDGFKSQAIRVYFDVGNIILYGFAEQWVRILGKRIAEVHFKDFRRAAGTGAGFVPLLAGDVNWPAVMKELKAIGYDGYVCAELGGYAHAPDQALRDAVTAMDAILAM